MIYPKDNSWYCHECQKGGTIIDWEMQEKGCDAAEAMRNLGGGRNGEVRKSKGKIVATYDYQDANGKLRFQVVRYGPKKFLQRRPDGKGWIDLHGVERVLYRLPEVMRDVRDGLTIFVCAGEKDALVMVAHGFGATTKAGGEDGKNWLEVYSETLRGADVIIVADKDKKGRARQAVASKLHGASVAFG
jgi:hypothetical protein